MKPPVIFLEDNTSKIALVMIDNTDLFNNREIFIFRHVEKAVSFMKDFIIKENPPSGLILCIDYDLGPGYETGDKFLSYAVEQKEFVSEIIIITQNTDMRDEMRSVCTENMIKSRIFKPY